MSGIADEIRIKDMIESLEYKRNHSQIARDALEVIEYLSKELADAKEHCSAFESLWTEAKAELEQVQKERDEFKSALRDGMIERDEIIKNLYAKEEETK